MNGRRVSGVLGALVAGATLAAVATAGSEATSAGAAYKVVGKWGKSGTGNSEFGNVFGLATDRRGNVYAADSDNHRVQIFSPKGGFLGAIPFGPEAFVPDVAVDAAGNVWGTNDTGGQAQLFTRSGRSLATVTTPKGARGIAVDAAGNMYVATHGDDVRLVVRFDKSGDQYAQGKSWGGFQTPSDVEVSPDGTVWVSDNGTLTVKRFDANGKLLKSMKAGPSAPVGIGVDLDCNVWVTDIAQRRLGKYSPGGKLLATAASPDLIAQDVVVGPKGDLYAYDVGTFSVVRFAEDRSQPAAASIPGKLTASKGAVKIAYSLSGVSCPEVVDATATLTGPGIAGKAAGLKLKAGGKNTIEMKLAKAASGNATFKIVLETNGRPTTETRSVVLVVK
jgi:sugar lactone lactonase YvrE